MTAHNPAVKSGNRENSRSDEIEFWPGISFPIHPSFSAFEPSSLVRKGSLDLHKPPLRRPVGFPAYRSQFPLVNRLLPALVGRKKQQLLLNQRAEQVEIEDLRHSRLGYVAEPGELCDASHLAAIKHALILDR
jgi:hypothetical protein